MRWLEDAQAVGSRATRVVLNRWARSLRPTLALALVASAVCPLAGPASASAWSDPPYTMFDPTPASIANSYGGSKEYATDARGGAMVGAWREGGVGESEKDILFHTFEDGSWSAPEVVGRATGSDYVAPQVQLSAEAAYVAWQREDGAIYVRRRARGAIEWETPQQVFPPQENHRKFQFDANARGDMVFWGYEGSNLQVAQTIIRRSIEGEWDEQRVPFLGYDDRFRSPRSIVISDAGHIVFAGQPFDGETPYAYRWARGSSTATGEDLKRANADTARYPSEIEVGIDGDGRITATWMQQRFGPGGDSGWVGRIETASGTIAHGFGPVTTLDALERGNEDPLLRVNERGDAVAVWGHVEYGDYNTPSWTLQMRTRKPGGAWSSIQQVDPVDAGSTRTPSHLLAIDEEGTMSLTFLQDRRRERGEAPLDLLGTVATDGAFAPPAPIASIPNANWGGLDPLATQVVGGTARVVFRQHSVGSGGFVEDKVLFSSDEPPPVVITSGPAGRTREAAPVFEWVAVDYDADADGSITFECRIDGGGWKACASGEALAALEDGKHTFNVRSVVREKFGPETTREFEVDTTGPEVSIVATPGTASVTATFSSEPGATIECAIGGAALEACPGEKTFGGLSPGAHSVKARASDDLGNPGPEKSRSVTIAGDVCEVPPGRRRRATGAGCSPVPGCAAAGQEPRRQVGPVVALAVTPAGCFKPQADGWASAGPVKVNGFQLTMTGNTRLVLTPEAGGAPGRLSLTGPATMEIPRAGIAWPVNALEWNGLSGSSSTQEIGLGVHSVVGELLIGAKASLGLSSADGGRSVIDVGANLPPVVTKWITKRGSKVGADGKKKGGSEVGADGKANITASNDKGVTGQLIFKVEPGAEIGALELSAMTVQYDTSGHAWAGTAEISLPHGELPETLPKPVVKAEIAFATRPSFALTRLALGVEKLNRPLWLWPWIYMQKLGGRFDFTPTKLGPQIDMIGSVGMSVGPHVEVPGVGSGRPLYDGAALSVEGDLRWRFPAPLSRDPFHLGIPRASGKLFWFQFASGYLDLQVDGRVSFGGELTWPIAGGLFNLKAKDGWVDGGEAFSVAGNGTYDGVFGRQAVTGIATHKGASACYLLGGKLIGYQRKLTPEYDKVLKKRVLKADEGQWFDNACDLKSFKVKRTGKASAAAAGPVRAGRVARGEDLAAFRLQGKGSAPRAKLVGPRGFSVTTRAGEGMWKRGKVSGVTDGDVTYVVVADPPAGRWKARALRGSAPIASVATADARPTPKVRARVIRKGKRFILAWKVRPIRGQRVVFSEEGADGKRVLRTTAARRGRLRFTPAPGVKDRKRTIRATVLQDGVPRRILKVASFKPAPG